MTEWDNLKPQSTTATYTSAVTEITGYVFDFFETDVSLTIDPSFAAAIIAGQGFATVDAVSKMDMSASVFNNLIFITTDSSDIDNTEPEDVVFSVENSYTDPFSSVAFSGSIVQSGMMNSAYANSTLSKDLIRHVAKSVTGGYAVADIFSNETELVGDVVTQDAALQTQLAAVITALNGAGGKTTNQFSALSSAHERFYNIAQALFTLNLNDNTRRAVLYSDIVANSADGQATTTIPLKFSAGDAIAVRINYDPASSPAPNMGGNAIPSRSYKLIIVLS